MTFSALSVIPPWEKTWGYDTFGLFCHTMRSSAAFFRHMVRRFCNRQ